MKIRYTYILFFALLLSKAAFSDSQNKNVDSIPDNVFEIGEKIIYDVKYGMIRGGEASCMIDIIPHGYSYAYHFVTYFKTVGVAKKLATIHDVYESYVEVGEFLPIKAIRNVTENSYQAYNEIVFERDSNRIFSSRDGFLYDVPNNSIDIIGAFYYARTYMYANDNKKNYIEIPLYHDKEILMLKMHFIKKEKIKTEYGTIRTKLFTPVIENAEYFTEEEDLKIWVSDDENHLPVKVSAKTPVGKFKLLLREHNGLKFELKTVKEIRKDEKSEVEEKEFFLIRMFNIFNRN